MRRHLYGAVELRQLLYFLAVAEELSFTRAAVRLHMAQPPLSVQIRKLETEIGVELFTRGSRDISLTPAGEIFLTECRHTLAQAEQSVRLARKSALGAVGHVSIGHVRSAEFAVLPSVVTSFRAAFPDVQFEFVSLPSAEQIQLVRRGRLDIGFVWMPVESDELEVVPIKVESLMAVLSSDHALAAQDSVSISELAPEPLVMFRREVAPPAFHAIEHEFARHGAQMNVAYELGSMMSVINFVAAGGGCGILPRFAAEVARDRVVYRDIDDLEVVYTLAIIMRRGPPGPADRFFHHVVASVSGCTGSSRQLYAPDGASG